MFYKFRHICFTLFSYFSKTFLNRFSIPHNFHNSRLYLQAWTLHLLFCTSYSFLSTFYFLTPTPSSFYLSTVGLRAVTCNEMSPLIRIIVTHHVRNLASPGFMHVHHVFNLASPRLHMQGAIWNNCKKTPNAHLIATYFFHTLAAYFKRTFK